MVVGSSPVAVTENSDFTPASSKKFLDIQATIECGLTLERVRDMIKTYSQRYRPLKKRRLTTVIKAEIKLVLRQKLTR